MEVTIPASQQPTAGQPLVTPAAFGTSFQQQYGISGVVVAEGIQRVEAAGPSAGGGVGPGITAASMSSAAAQGFLQAQVACP